MIDSVDLLHFENHGNVGVEFYGGIPGGSSLNAPSGTFGLVPTSSLYSLNAVPEPSSLVLMGLGGVGLVLARVRVR